MAQPMQPLTKRSRGNPRILGPITDGSIRNSSNGSFGFAQTKIRVFHVEETGQQ
jgi:hypothetical protein